MQEMKIKRKKARQILSAAAVLVASLNTFFTFHFVPSHKPKWFLVCFYVFCSTSAQFYSVSYSAEESERGSYSRNIIEE